jgi:hypothetical protein
VRTAGAVSFSTPVKSQLADMAVARFPSDTEGGEWMSRARRNALRERLGEVNREWRILYKSEKTTEVRERLKRLNEQRIELVAQIVELAPYDQSNLVA